VSPKGFSEIDARYDPKAFALKRKADLKIICSGKYFYQSSCAGGTEVNVLKNKIQLSTRSNKVDQR